MQNVWDPKNATLKLLAEFFFYMWPIILSDKHIVNNLKRFKKVLWWHYLYFGKKNWKFKKTYKK